MKKVEAVIVWAWEIRNEGSTGAWSLCHWAEPYRNVLLAGQKPSPEARPVKVVMMRHERAKKGKSK
jgi:hypothetical protein